MVEGEPGGQPFTAMTDREVVSAIAAAERQLADLRAIRRVRLVDGFVAGASPRGLGAQWDMSELAVMFTLKKAARGTGAPLRETKEGQDDDS